MLSVYALNLQSQQHFEPRVKTPSLLTPPCVCLTTPQNTLQVLCEGITQQLMIIIQLLCDRPVSLHAIVPKNWSLCLPAHSYSHSSDQHSLLVKYKDQVHLQLMTSKLHYQTVVRCRHVILPPDVAKLVPKTHLMTETEWRNIGVQQSPGWIHYMLHKPGMTLISVINDCQNDISSDRGLRKRTENSLSISCHAFWKGNYRLKIVLNVCHLIQLQRYIETFRQPN